MPSIAPLTAGQIADLYGAINENVGTGDGVTKDFQLDYHPIVVERITQDELVGVGDGVQVNYQLQYYPVAAGTLKLYRTAVATANQLNPPSHVTPHYTVVEATGAVTLTVAGVAFLGTEQLHAAYSVPSTLELHKTSISGPLLVPGTDYSVVAYSGKITLTDAGVTALGTSALYAKYQTANGLVNVLLESNASLRGTLANGAVMLEDYEKKDTDLKDVHEAIASKAIVPVEEERRHCFNAYVILFIEAGNYVVAATEEVTEPRIVHSVEAPYTDSSTNAPLYPILSFPLPARQPDIAKPNFSTGLTGGTGVDPATLEFYLARELIRIPIVQAAGGDFPGPGGWDDRYTAALANPFGQPGMITSINAELNLLDDGGGPWPGGNGVIQALVYFIASNSPSNEYVTVTDITNAQTAQTNAQNFYSTTLNYLNNDVTPPPHSGLSNANLAARTAIVTAYQTYLMSTRKGQVTTILGAPSVGLYHKRFFWITMRAAMGTGTLANIVSVQQGSAKAQTQIVENDGRIAEVMLVIGAQ